MLELSLGLDNLMTFCTDDELGKLCILYSCKVDEWVTVGPHVERVLDGALHEIAADLAAAQRGTDVSTKVGMQRILDPAAEPHLACVCK